MNLDATEDFMEIRLSKHSPSFESPWCIAGAVSGAGFRIAVAAHFELESAEQFTKPRSQYKVLPLEIRGLALVFHSISQIVQEMQLHCQSVGLLSSKSEIEIFQKQQYDLRTNFTRRNDDHMVDAWILRKGNAKLSLSTTIYVDDSRDIVALALALP